jgi:hypothetical protein
MQNSMLGRVCLRLRPRLPKLANTAGMGLQMPSLGGIISIPLPRFPSLHEARGKNISTEDENDALVEGNSQGEWRTRDSQPRHSGSGLGQQGTITTPEERWGRGGPMRREIPREYEHHGEERWYRGPDSAWRERRSPLPDNRRWDRESDSDDPRGLRQEREIREERGYGDTRWNQRYPEYRDERDVRREREWRDFRDSRDYRDSRGPADYRDGRDYRDFRDDREARDYRGYREDRDYRRGGWENEQSRYPDRNDRWATDSEYKGKRNDREEDANDGSRPGRKWARAPSDSIERERQERALPTPSRAEGTEPGIPDPAEGQSTSRRFDSGDLDIRKWGNSTKVDPKAWGKRWSEDEAASKKSGVSVRGFKSSSNDSKRGQDEDDDHGIDEEGNYDHHHATRTLGDQKVRGGEFSNTAEGKKEH